MLFDELAKLVKKLEEEDAALDLHFDNGMKVSEHEIFAIANLFSGEEMDEIFNNARLRSYTTSWSMCKFNRQYSNTVVDICIGQSEAKTEEELVGIYNMAFDMACRAYFKDNTEFKGLAADIKKAMAGEDTVDISETYAGLIVKVKDMLTEIFACLMAADTWKTKFKVDTIEWLKACIDNMADKIAKEAYAIKQKKATEKPEVEQQKPEKAQPTSQQQNQKPKKPVAQVSSRTMAQPAPQPQDNGIRQVAAAVGGTGDVRIDFGKFVEEPKPVETVSYVPPVGQPTQQAQAIQQVNPAVAQPEQVPPVPTYVSPVSTNQQPMQNPNPMNPQVVQQPVATAQPTQAEAKHMPGGPLKRGLYNAKSLNGVALDEKLTTMRKHYKLLDGTHPGVDSTFVDILLSAVTVAQVINKANKSGITIPPTGLTFTEIPVPTYQGLIDTSYYDIAFRCNQQTPKGESMIMYLSTKDLDKLTMTVFIPSEIKKDKKKAKQRANQQHPQECACGNC